MTIYDLVNQTTIQGDIQISKFDEDGNEIILVNVKGVSDLADELPEEYEDMTVNYIFNSDGIIHIEVTDEN